MKLYNVTFDLVDQKWLSQSVVADTVMEAEKQCKRNIIGLIGQEPTNISANAVVFGIDGPGKSLNKMKKLVPPKKKKVIKK